MTKTGKLTPDNNGLEIRYEYKNMGTLWSHGMSSSTYISECEPISASCVERGIPLLKMKNEYLCGQCGRATHPIRWTPNSMWTFRSEKPLITLQKESKDEL